MPKITILGSGAMATACAILLSDNSQDVTIWGRNPEYIKSMKQSRCNDRLLPGIEIPESIEFTSDIAAAVDSMDYLVISIPSRSLRESLTENASLLQQSVPVISVVKGIEVKTFCRPSQIIEQTLGPRQVVSLSGPSHAEEVGHRLPASVVAACPDLNLATDVQQMFSTDRFRVYTNHDLIGVELAGALKNIIGIAAGICDGLKFGDNAKSALMARGIVEMSRFGESLGADASTFPGLAGVGDLITTCISPHGRNRYVGERLGQGETLSQIMETMTSAAEGVTTCNAVFHLAKQHQIEMPITSEVYQVLFEDKPALDATEALMLRPHKQE